MAAKRDMINTLEYITNFWPDLVLSEQDLVSCNPDFITRFYSTFIAEINDKISYLINDEITNDEFDDIQEFDKEVIVYCKVAKLFKKIKYLASLNLADFYRQNPKKMYPCVKFSIHFVVYINNFLDEIFDLLNENYKALTEIENLKGLKEQLLQDTADNAENIARLQDSSTSLNAKLEDTKKLHEKMMQKKIIEEKIMLEKTTELNTLQREIDNYEYELKLLEDQEEDLKECIITERDYEALRNTEKCLEIVQQRLCHTDTDGDVDEKVENVKQLEQFEKMLASLSLDSLQVETLHELRQEITSSKNTQKKLSDELSSLTTTTNTILKRIENLKQTLEKAQLYSATLKKKIRSTEEDEAKRYENEIAKYSKNFEECQSLETEIILKQEEIKRIEEGERKLNSTVAEEYQRILNMEKKTTEKFFETLGNVKNRSESDK